MLTQICIPILPDEQEILLEQEMSVREDKGILNIIINKSKQTELLIQQFRFLEMN